MFEYFSLREWLHGQIWILRQKKIIILHIEYCVDAMQQIESPSICLKLTLNPLQVQSISCCYGKY